MAKPSAKPRLAGRDLAVRIQDLGFTPSVRDVDALLDLLEDEETSKAAERAIARVGPAALKSLSKRLQGAAPPARSLLVRVVGRLVSGGSAEGVPVLLTALSDSDPKTRRNAAIALGKVRSEEVEGALLAAWEADPRPEMRRSVAAALGKVGTERSLSLLREAISASEGELSRIAAQAATMVERTASRPDRGSVDASRAPERPTSVIVLARGGLEDLLANELASCPGLSEVRTVGSGRVAAELGAPLETLFGARTMLAMRFEMPSDWVRDGDTVSAAIARIVSSEAAR